MEKIENKSKEIVKQLENGGPRDGGRCEVVHELGALANVVLHRLGFPTESEGYVLDG